MTQSPNAEDSPTANLKQLSRSDVIERMASHGTTHYLDFFSVMQGVALAAGGASLVGIADAGWSVSSLLMLLVAFMAVAVAHAGATTGAVLLNLYPSPIDLLLPMVIAVAEFALLFWPGEISDSNTIPLEWFAVLASWNLLAGFLVLRILQAHGDHRYADDMHDVIKMYRPLLRRDYRGAFGTGTVTLAVLVLWWLEILPATATAQYCLAGVVIAAFSGAIYGHRKSYLLIDSHLGVRTDRTAEEPT